MNPPFSNSSHIFVYQTYTFFQLYRSGNTLSAACLYQKTLSTISHSHRFLQVITVVAIQSLGPIIVIATTFSLRVKHYHMVFPLPEHIIPIEMRDSKKEENLIQG